MNEKKLHAYGNKNRHFLLALHSCSETFGVSTLDLRNKQRGPVTATFDVGRSLSNNIFNCIEEIIPKSTWSEITRIGVAIGPGRFTGTRLSVVLARTLAQQLNCYLDGVSSFRLMAPRLALNLKQVDRKNPFWIVNKLERRGIVGGKYQIKENKSCNKIENDVIEIIAPHLIKVGESIIPSINAIDNISTDVIELLNYTRKRHESKHVSNWKTVKPIYPTSPVDNI